MLTYTQLCTGHRQMTHFSLGPQERVGPGFVSSSSGPVQHEREKHQEGHCTHSKDKSEPGASWEKGKHAHLLCTAASKNQYVCCILTPSDRSCKVFNKP